MYTIKINYIKHTKTEASPTPGASTPTECTDSNQGRCECGDVSKGFTTYTFWVGDVQRCFTVYRPINRASDVLPVVLTSQCYGNDKLMSINMKNDRTDENKAAAQYGFSRIGLSTPDGYWTFGNDGVVNDQRPMPGSDEDGKDIPYLKAVFNFIESNPSQFDVSKIYAEGFSQNSMFSAYIGFCFNDKVVGIWQGGSGMALNLPDGRRPNLPGLQAQCTASAFTEYQRRCLTEDPCTECQYWPIYPCYQPQRAMIDCVVEYTNDGISVDVRGGTGTSSAVYMYEALVNEGHDARLLRFDPSDDDTIPGGHKNPQNTPYWQVGCWGITSPCSDACESAFISCVNSNDVSTAAKRAKAFSSCIAEQANGNLQECATDCAPTLDMLMESETPTTMELSNFGAENTTTTREPRPDTSLCEVED